jgi:ParB family chromosome partitioning protein
MEIEISKIKVAERIRKEITRISELAEDIKQNGLLHPVIVMPLDGEDFRLLAGLRRVKATESLGWTKIEANVVAPADAEAEMRIEISENEQREPFTFSERVDYGKLIEEIEKAKAKERMSIGGKGGIDKEGVPQGAHLEKGRTREKVAEKIGMGKTNYERAKYIADHASPEVIEELDKGERTIRGTYDELRAKEKKVKPPKSGISTQSEPPAKKHKSYEEAVKTDPFFKKLEEEEDEAVRKRKEYEALPPEGKIADLQRQIKELRERAIIAESDLATLKGNYKISIDHKDSIIDSLKRQNENLIRENTELNDALAAANARDGGV